MSTVFHESKSSNFKVYWGLGSELNTNSLLLHSFSQRKWQVQPTWNVQLGNNIYFLMGGATKDLWIMAIYTTLDGEVKIPGLWSVIAKGKCLLECLANLYQLPLPITVTKEPQKAMFSVESHDKVFYKRKNICYNKFLELATL